MINSGGQTVPVETTARVKRKGDNDVEYEVEVNSDFESPGISEGTGWPAGRWPAWGEQQGHDRVMLEVWMDC